ncbi:MAG: 3-oxoacyl-ACP reductase FabG [Betaproteobacteria bacterium]|nr:3-oxoacyl-ACP reductase FabG [Betaproteobacteria bacterium]
MAATAIYPTLKDRVAIVTGSGQGLGRTFVRHFAAQGAIPVIAEINGDAAAALQEELQAQGRRALAVRTDVTDPVSVAAMVERTLAEFGRIDVLVNNAAMLQHLTMGPFWELSPEEWRRTIDVSITGTFLCSRAVVPAMQKARWGRIVNLSSTIAVSGRPNYLHYTACKSSMLGMTKAMARALGEWNITVNALLPGTTKTDTERTSAQGDHFERAMREQSIQRLAEMSDHASVILFLCSDDAGFVTGQSLICDGGRHFI